MPERRLDVDDDAYATVFESQRKFGVCGAQCDGGARPSLARREPNGMNAQVRVKGKGALLDRGERLGEGEIDAARSRPRAVEDAAFAHDVRGRQQRVEGVQVDTVELAHDAHDEARGARLREARAEDDGHDARLGRDDVRWQLKAAPRDSI
jgi:hypothetical protein